MKTIIFETKEQYLEMKKAWKASCADQSIFFSSYHYALYAIIRGKDPAKCFAAPEKQSKKKLSCQGKSGNEAYLYAMGKIESGFLDNSLLAPFAGTLTKDQLILMRAELEKGKN